MLQMLNHGVSTGALFLIVGFIYERRHTRLITDFGGLSKQMPIFATIFMIVTFSSVGLPGTNGFVGEFLVLIGAFESHLRWWTIIATSGVILSAVYMLWMFQRVMFGELDNPKNQKLSDLNCREITLMVPLIVLIFVMGLYPKPFIDRMDPAVQKLVSHVRSACSLTPYCRPAAAAVPAPAVHPEVKPSVTKIFEKALQGIQFESSKDVIKPVSFPVLDQIVQVMKENPDYLLEIGGHSDNSGNPESNLLLSQQRANSVKNYLVNKGVSENRITAKGFGDTRPLVPNTTAANKAKNRRVEFVVKFKQEVPAE